jgi:drug/metabolite transporter (DMT)-like permease
VTLPNATRRPDATALWLVFGALSMAWGSSFLFIKIGVEEGLPPLSLVSFRLWIASAFLLVALRLMGGRLPRGRAALGRLAVLSVINVIVPFSLITWGEQWISSALAGILNGLVPLFTIVIAAVVLRDEPLTSNRLIGLLIGFAGAVLLLSPNLGTAPAGVDSSMALLGELAVVVASLSYACSAVFIRHFISGQPLMRHPRDGTRPLRPVELALTQCLIAASGTTLLAFVFERSGGLLTLPPTPAAWLSVAWLGIIGSAIAYLLFFRLISAWDATRTTLVTYVMPIVAIALGVVLLNERLDPAEILGAALVIGGLVLANSSVGQRRLYGRQPAREPASD